MEIIFPGGGRINRSFVAAKMKIRAVLIILGLSIIYFLDNFAVNTLGRGQISRLLIALCWLGLVLIIWRLPRPRVAGRLRLQGFLRILALLCGVFYLLIMAAGGFIEGFGKSPYVFTPLAVLINLFWLALSIMGTELARSYLINGLSSRKPHLLIILVSTIFFLWDVSLSKMLTLKTLQQIVNFAGTTLMPGISENLFVSYLAYLGGAAPAIIYRIVVEGFQWFSPRLPNLSWVSKTLLGCTTPFICLLLVQYLYQDAARESERSPAKKEGYGEWLIVSTLSILIIWFSVGIFPIYPSVIATGSMEPLIRPGDITILKKVKDLEIREGDVIHFRKDKVFITHRVVEVLDPQAKVYKTKGDNNEAVDSEPVSKQQIKGKLLYVIPKAGWPTLWLRSQIFQQVGSEASP